MFGGSTVRTIQTVFDAQDRASGKISDVEQAGDRASESLEQTEQRLGSVTQAMAFTGAATAALGGTIGLLTQKYSQLGEQFAVIQTTAGANEAQMDQLRGSVKDLANSYPTTMRQATEATKALSFAGLSATETMAALQETTELAVASNLQAGQSAQIVAQSLNAFNLEARQADAVVGSLSATFSSSSTRVRQLSNALTEVQSTASAAGASVSGTLAALGVLADNGLQASKAGTSLNAVMSRLTGSSSETQEAMRQLGLSTSDFTDSSGDLKNVNAIMGTLSQSMEGVESQADRVRLAQQLAGREGARALLPLLRSTDQLTRKYRENLRAQIRGAVGDLAEMEDAELSNVSEALGMEVSGETNTTALISNLQGLAEQGESTADISSRLEVGLGLTEEAAGLLAEQVTQTDQSAKELAEGITGVTTAAELAESKSESLGGQIKQLRSSFEVLGYEIFQGTKPAVTTFVGSLNSVVSPLAENETAAKALGVGLVGATGAMALATGGLGALAVNLQIAQIQEARLLQTTATYNVLTKAAAAATLAKNKAVWLATASSGALALKTAGLIGTLSGEIAAQYASATAALSNATALGILSGAAGLAAAGISAVWTALGPIGLLALGVTAAVIGLAGVMSTDLFGAGEAAGNVLGFFAEKAGMAWRIGSELLGILFELGRIGTMLGGLALIAPFAALLKLPELPGMIRGVIPKAKAAATRLPGQIVAGLNSLGKWKYLLPVLGPVLAIRDGIDRFGPQLRQAAMNLPANIVAGLNSLGPAKYALPLLGPLLLAKDIITNPNEWREAGAEIPDMIASGIADAADAPVDAVAGVVSDVRGYLPFSPADKGPLSTLDQTGPALVSTIADGVESNQGQLTSALQATLGATPLGIAGGAALDVSSDAAQSVSGESTNDAGGKRIEITVNNEIVLEGEAGDVAAEVERAAESGTTTAFEEFLRRISRELNGGVGAQQ